MNAVVHECTMYYAHYTKRPSCFFLFCFFLLFFTHGLMKIENNQKSILD